MEDRTGEMSRNKAIDEINGPVKLCDAAAPARDGGAAYQCNRGKGHPGEHCRQMLDLSGYQNRWWTNEEAKNDGNNSIC